MENKNEKFVLTVMEKIKDYLEPAHPVMMLYNAYLIGQQDEESKKYAFDVIPQLTKMIIDSFPAPIRQELLSLVKLNTDKDEKDRINMMIRVYDRFFKFISYIIIIQIWEGLRTQKINLKNDKAFLELMSSWFLKPASGGSFWSIIYHGATVLKKNNIDFMGQFDPALFHSKSLIKKVDYLFSSRNSFVKGKTKINAENFENNFNILIRELSFIIKYKFIAIEEISILKKRFDNAKYQHYLQDFNVGQKRNLTLMDGFYENNAAVLIDDIIKPKYYLNLSPLVIYVNNKDVRVIIEVDKYETRKITDIAVFNKFTSEGNVIYDTLKSDKQIILEGDFKRLFSVMKEDFDIKKM